MATLGRMHVLFVPHPRKPRGDGVPPEKVSAIWEYETSDLFDEPNAPCYAWRRAGTSPNAFE